MPQLQTVERHKFLSQTFKTLLQRLRKNGAVQM